MFGLLELSCVNGGSGGKILIIRSVIVGRTQPGSFQSKSSIMPIRLSERQESDPCGCLEQCLQV